MSNSTVETEGAPFPLRKPCRCGGFDGEIRPRNGQNCVFCTLCNAFQYNAPKTETGERPRPVVPERDPIKPKQRARILERDGGRCFLCGQQDGVLHIGHMLSVDAGRALGCVSEEIGDDENLVTMCEACNLGFGSETLSPRFALLLSFMLRAKIRSRNIRPGGDRR